MEENKDNILLAIRESDLQHEANSYLGRSLTEEEIDISKKALEFGVFSGIDIIYRTIFTEIIHR